jgi:hypothetical protein
MRSLLVIEHQIAPHALLGVADGLIGMELDLFIFETPP